MPAPVRWELWKVYLLRMPPVAGRVRVRGACMRARRSNDVPARSTAIFYVLLFIIICLREQLLLLRRKLCLLLFGEYIQAAKSQVRRQYPKKQNIKNTKASKGTHSHQAVTAGGVCLAQLIYSICAGRSAGPRSRLSDSRLCDCWAAAFRSLSQPFAAF
jgi:hypothetical protein